MDNQALHICHICQEREDLQMVDECVCLFLASLDIEGEDAAAAVGEVLLVQCMIRMFRQ